MTNQEAIDRLRGLYGNYYPEQEKALDMAIDALKHKPKKGKWIHQNDDRNDWLECSECEYGSDGEVKMDAWTPYCPYCGAKMEANK